MPVVEGGDRLVGIVSERDIVRGLAVHGADIQDRDGAPLVIEAACETWPSLSHLFADGGYAGWKLELALPCVWGAGERTTIRNHLEVESLAEEADENLAN